MNKQVHTDCLSMLVPVQDALCVINGKWKLLILISISSGNSRFREIERSIPRITSKVLSKELKDLEENLLINRTVRDGYPVTIDYTTTDYFMTLENVVQALKDWGINHRKMLTAKS
jgi:DNA-binding HxlR family transcriptional regulator